MGVDVVDVDRMAFLEPEHHRSFPEIMPLSSGGQIGQEHDRHAIGDISIIARSIAAAEAQSLATAVPLWRERLQHTVAPSPRGGGAIHCRILESRW